MLYSQVITKTKYKKHILLSTKLHFIGPIQHGFSSFIFIWCYSWKMLRCERRLGRFVTFIYFVKVLCADIWQVFPQIPVTYFSCGYHKPGIDSRILCLRWYTKKNWDISKQNKKLVCSHSDDDCLCDLSYLEYMCGSKSDRPLKII